MQDGGRFDGIASELATESDEPGLFTDDEDVVVFVDMSQLDD